MTIRTIEQLGRQIRLLKREKFLLEKKNRELIAENQRMLRDWGLSQGVFEKTVKRLVKENQLLIDKNKEMKQLLNGYQPFMH